MKKLSTQIKDINRLGFGFAVLESRSLAEGILLLTSERCGDIDDPSYKGEALDYYGEFRGGYPWIHPELESWAAKNGFFWEWENPGTICLCEA